MIKNIWEGDIMEQMEQKQLLLRMSNELWQDLVILADKEFRSVNSQIEYLLTQCVNKMKEEKKL